ncbi:hypothetical protein AB0C15_14765 [Micromonospora sp. NPDC048835]|uniref:hypothetical protein n=1 Tax=Micromonospora sp. NPDC048835 TaxID=3155147 RepID=UPI0033DDAC12
MIAKPLSGMFTSVVAPLGIALADAPWGVVVGAFFLALAHRILPRESKDLLNLWLRIVPRRQGPKDKQDKGQGT